MSNLAHHSDESLSYDNKAEAELLDKYGLKASYIDIPFNDFPGCLPLGIYPENEAPIRSFRLEEYTGHHELKLGELEDYYKKKGLGYSEYIFHVYSSLLSYRPFLLLDETPIADVAFRQGMSVRDLIGQMYLVDVLCILLSIRYQEYGDAIALSGECPCPRRFAIREGTSEQPPHSMDGIIVRCWTGESELEIVVPLFSPVYSGDRLIESVTMKPLKFKSLVALEEMGDAVPYLSRLVTVCSDELTLADYVRLHRRDKRILEWLVQRIHLGPDRELGMICHACGRTWSNMMLIGLGYEFFYATLLSAPRTEKKSTQQILDEQVFFLCTGEQALFDSAASVLDLSPRRRNFFVTKQSDSYEKQAEEMKKNKK